MASSFGPGRELMGLIIAALREDGDLNAYLFPEPPLDLQDARIWASDVELPENLRGVLPRILIEINTDSANYEQDDDSGGPVDVYTHVFTPRDQGDLGEYLDARLRVIFGSTIFSSDRIIGGKLTQAGKRIKAREAQFNDARRLTSPYMVRNVGVIAT